MRTYRVSIIGAFRRRCVDPLRSAQAGTSLIEMLVALSIFGILSTALLGLLLSTVQTSRISKARTVASHAPITMRVTKEALRALQARVDPAEDEALILKAYLSKDFAEGMDAFLNKRKPAWTGS